MLRKFIPLVAVVCLAAPGSTSLLAQESLHSGDFQRPPTMRGMRAHPTTGESRDSSAPTSQPAPDEPVSTDHEILIDGQPFKYKATAGTLPLTDDAGRPRARMFFVAYEKSPDSRAASQPSTRPITFVFNGGPGAAAIWLHMGTGGPRRVHLPADGTPPAPPFSLDDNAHTWLAATDLVFIDPVGTGYSRAESPDKAKEFYGVRQDIDSVAEFIRDYCTRYQRWPAPKFIAGESYGTTRAAGLSEHLLERYGIALNGIVLISTVLNFQTIDFGAGNDLPYPLYVPSYTAIAHYHKKLPQDLQADLKKAVAESQTWALGDYTNALLKGSALPDAQRAKIIDQLARYTGLPRDYVDRSNLRINPNRFEKALLQSDRRIIGRMDGRITAFDSDPLNDSPEFDPSVSGYVGPFSSTFNDYVRRDLKFKTDLTYEFLTGNVRPWDFGPAGNGYLDVASTLRRCLVKLPSLKVFIASGYYDLATPFTAADYTVNRMPISPMLHDNIRHNLYQGGHMMYLNEPAMRELNRDLNEFFTRAAK